MFNHVFTKGSEFVAIPDELLLFLRVLLLHLQQSPHFLIQNPASVFLATGSPRYLPDGLRINDLVVTDYQNCAGS